MLVLSRKPNESIMIGDNVEVKIVEVKGDYVKLGITAPKTIPVHRKEVFEAIQRENMEAAQSQVTDIDKLGDILSPKKDKSQEKPDKGSSQEKNDKEKK